MAGILTTFTESDKERESHQGAEWTDTFADTSYGITVGTKSSRIAPEEHAAFKNPVLSNKSIIHSASILLYFSC